MSFYALTGIVVQLYRNQCQQRCKWVKSVMRQPLAYKVGVDTAVHIYTWLQALLNNPGFEQLGVELR